MIIGTEINLEGKYVLPGCIDDQVHFANPLTHKGNIRTESRAAVRWYNPFMEMPNTKPNATSQELLEDKYQIAKDSIANYSFFMGATNDNLNEVLKQIQIMSVGLKFSWAPYWKHAC